MKVKLLKPLLTLIALALLITACATIPPVSPAPPPGSSQYAADSESWEGVDGKVEVPNDRHGRDRAYVAMRDYCGGAYTVVSEDKRLTVTPLSFPFPVRMVEMAFRCGDDEE